MPINIHTMMETLKQNELAPVSQQRLQNSFRASSMTFRVCNMAVIFGIVFLRKFSLIVNCSEYRTPYEKKKSGVENLCLTRPEKTNPPLWSIERTQELHTGMVDNSSMRLVQLQTRAKQWWGKRAKGLDANIAADRRFGRFGRSIFGATDTEQGGKRMLKRNEGDKHHV